MTNFSKQFEFVWTLKVEPEPWIERRAEPAAVRIIVNALGVKEALHPLATRDFPGFHNKALESVCNRAK